MSKKNGRIHFNILTLSTIDTVELCRAVQQRFLDLCEAFLRIRGVRLVPPTELDQSLLYWRQMVVRHKGGDYSNTDDELRATKIVAQWTVDVNRAMRNQKPLEVAWKG